MLSLIVALITNEVSSEIIVVSVTLLICGIDPSEKYDKVSEINELFAMSVALT